MPNLTDSLLLIISTVIKIDAIDSVHIFVVDLLANARQDGTSHMTLVDSHHFIVGIHSFCFFRQIVWKIMKIGLSLQKVKSGYSNLNTD